MYFLCMPHRHLPGAAETHGVVRDQVRMAPVVAAVPAAAVAPVWLRPGRGYW